MASRCLHIVGPVVAVAVAVVVVVVVALPNLPAVLLADVPPSIHAVVAIIPVSSLDAFSKNDRQLQYSPSFGKQRYVSSPLEARTKWTVRPEGAVTSVMEVLAESMISNADDMSVGP
mmetsp:Transcript_10607/g.19439  ORF Transcript_10607/g.19439 Transcript_10607/m.19439 type:complete len:117 (-) Transcript_10607:237-587(-)